MYPEEIFSDTNVYCTKESAITLQCNNQKQLARLLEHLSATNDINMLLKIFSCLSAYIIYKKGAPMNVVVKCNAVYGKINYVLEKGLPRKALDALNFLSALLYIDAEEEETTTRKALAMYARNMTRISGCLAAMTEMFTHCMMYHDTWKALCQCLAVACTECEMNQSYCTHLIPICIQKCSQQNMEVLLVLQALLINHSRNIKLFINCNGIAIFTRDLLHYDKCLHLLMIVVQCSETSALHVRESGISDILQSFLQLYGPNSQLGQKAVIILNHIESRVRANRSQKKNILEKTKQPISPKEKSAIKCMKLYENEMEQTNVLMQNVMKELFQWKQEEMRNKEKKRNISKDLDANINILNSNSMLSKQAMNKRNETQTGQNKVHCNIATELSFSFLDNIGQGSNSSMKQNNGSISLMSINISTGQNKRQIASAKDTMSLDIKDFRPLIHSTPKHFKKFRETQVQPQHCTENTIAKIPSFKRLRNTQTREQKLYNIRERRSQRKIEKRQSMKEYDRDTKNRSLSSRFFSAINESCTTIVKTVKSMFTSKRSLDNSDSSSNATNTENVCSESQSFMKFMKKRDAAELINKSVNNNISKLSNETNCKTCDDTFALKQKLVKDKELKRTIQKLKTGINLYGCDFKKISRTMWPRDSYMTPEVLYNLYRKLILK